MKEKKTKYKYMYDALVLEMTSGKLQYGATLPSIRALCQIYGVSTQTVRNVVTALRKEGYIETVERSHTKVIYGAGDRGGSVQQAREQLARRDAVMGLLQTLEILLPHVFAEASKLCDAAQNQALRREVTGIDDLDIKGKWRKSTLVFQRISSVYHNALLQDLYNTLDLFVQMTPLPGIQSPYFTLFDHIESWMNRLIDRIHYEDYNGVYTLIRDMYRRSASLIDAYYNRLQEAYPDISPVPATFSWNAETGRVCLYMEVARSIIHRIGQREYKDGECLPSSLQLQKEYSISSYTMGRVLEVLESTGLVQRMNRHGKYVINRQAARTKDIFIKGTTPRADAITFLSAVQLVALISRGIALLGFDYLTREEVKKILKELDNQENRTPPNGIMLRLVALQPNEPLKEIYRQLDNLMLWGYFFGFVRDKEDQLLILRDKCKVAMEYVQKGNKNAFADMLQNIYYQIFRVMQGALVGFGVEDAAQLRLP